MSQDHATDAVQSKSKRSKTDLACDTCRRRKSRCDGRRPACSHCENMGLVCIYRPPLTSLETDASVLARISQLEARIADLDQGRRDTNSTLGSLDNATMKPWPKVPEFHHAAAHKMFHYWSKLRINLTIPDLEPLKFLRQVDDADKALFAPTVDSHLAAEIPISIVIKGIDSLFENLHRLPFVLRHLFTYGGLTSEACLDTFKRYLIASPGHDVMLNFNAQSVEELLLQAVGLKHLAVLQVDQSLSQKADLCFRYALRQILDMQARQNPQALPFKFLFVILLLYVYGRPFHALGLLQSFESLIHNASPNLQQDMVAKSQYEAFLHQYYILESDILSEIDGVPSQRLHNIAVALATDRATNTPNFDSNEPNTPGSDDYSSHELQAHLRMRGYMNSVLDNLYILNRAYCRPEDVAIVLTDIAKRLDLWYWTLPLDIRFPRHPSAFVLASQGMSDIMDELRFRYYATIFLVNRPVLYHVLYEKYENAVNSQSSGGALQDPWVYESCHNCVQNATMIILLHSKRHQTSLRDYFESWCNLQHLVAAYAIILQIQNSARLSILLQDSGDPDVLLDATEAVLERGLNRPANIRETLSMLRHVRQNFQKGTPRTPSGGSGFATSPVYSVKSH